MGGTSSPLPAWAFTTQCREVGGMGELGSPKGGMGELGSPKGDMGELGSPKGDMGELGFPQGGIWGDEVPPKI
jgi:hypothetical protein